jgi:hypothetical protein
MTVGMPSWRLIRPTHEARMITTTQAKAGMRYLIFASLISLLLILNTGFYNEVSDSEITRIYFIKKHPTFRMQFFNIHANDGNYRRIEKLTNEQRQDIIDYCKYRLGIDSEITTQADIETCAKR